MRLRRQEDQRHRVTRRSTGSDAEFLLVQDTAGDQSGDAKPAGSDPAQIDEERTPGAGALPGPGVTDGEDPGTG
jgi:hypothetical protein